MFQIITDKEILLDFYHAEQSLPQWFQDCQNAWLDNEQDYLEFCERCKVYQVGNALILLDRKSKYSAEVHFSVKGKIGVGKTVAAIEEIKHICFEQNINLIYGWIARKNYGLRKLCSLIGFNYFGFRMFYGQSHGRPIEWIYVAISKENNLVVSKRESVLN